ncbi:hypothetical protein LZ31DRAFT_52739 [Colletotrichum somersetense]|nr:hypothetical protein LZ31DRAFT_52739 [Colletotrichum somersetense]
MAEFSLPPPPPHSRLRTAARPRGCHVVRLPSQKEDLQSLPGDGLLCTLPPPISTVHDSKPRIRPPAAALAPLGTSSDYLSGSSGPGGLRLRNMTKPKEIHSRGSPNELLHRSKKVVSPLHDKLGVVSSHPKASRMVIRYQG